MCGLLRTVEPDTRLHLLARVVLSQHYGFESIGAIADALRRAEIE